MTDEVRDTEPTRLRIWGTWLVLEVDEHTCGTGSDGHYGHHEPGCGLIPEVDLSTLPGWDDLVRAERAEALRAAAGEWMQGHWADDLPPQGASRPQLILGMAKRATAWLRERADRIEREGQQ